MATLELRTWQFVRLMVFLEESQNHKKATQIKALYQEWQDSWAEIDQSLAQLIEEDFDAYANMMMEQAVTLPLPSTISQKELHALFNAFIQQLEASKKETKNKEAKSDIAFEISELKRTIETLTHN